MYCIICRSWRLLVRASTWGIGRQVALYKKGEQDTFKSWRNIIVNTQMGLLMERLFWNRIKADVRKSLGASQTGYIYRCEYHALVFHELAAGSSGMRFSHNRLARGSSRCISENLEIPHLSASRRVSRVGSLAFGVVAGVSETYSSGSII